MTTTTKATKATKQDQDQTQTTPYPIPVRVTSSLSSLSLEELQSKREQASTPGVKAALTKAIMAQGGTVPSVKPTLTAQGIISAHDSQVSAGDMPTTESVLAELGFPSTPGYRARVRYLQNRGLVPDFS